MLLDTELIIKLDFNLCGRSANFLLASYVESKKFLSSVTKQVTFIVDFLLWHKNNSLNIITQESVTEYKRLLYENKSKSYADVIHSYIKSFCGFLNQLGLIPNISFSEKFVGKKEDPLKLHKVFNYYKYLGIPKTSLIQDIKRAYHNKARFLHPDVNPNDPNSTYRISSLNRIYGILREDSSRILYDVTMGFRDYEDFMDSIPDDQWHEKSYYLVWI